MRFRILACSLMMLGLVAPAVQAGSMDMVAEIIGRFDSTTFDPLPLNLLPNGRVAPGNAGAYQVELRFTAEAGDGEKGWAATVFSAQATGSGLSLLDGTWAAHNPTFDSNGAAPGGVVPIYGTNTDGGVSDQDLQNIVVSIASATIQSTALDGRNRLGTADGPAVAEFPTLMGSFFVNWDGTGVADVNIGDHTYAFTSTNDTFLPAVPGLGTSAGFGEDDGGDDFEVNDLFLGGALPGALINGGPLSTNATTADIAWSLVSLIGPDGAEAGASVDPATGVFSWQSAPTDSRGQYTATIQGINSGAPAGTDTGLLTFNLVPEPSSITLLGLAMVGGLGFIRRR